MSGRRSHSVFQRSREDRVFALHRLLGDLSLAESLIHEEETLASGLEVDAGGASRGSFIDLANAGIAARLGVDLETAVRRRVIPEHGTVEDGGHLFLLPPWLARDHDAVCSGRFGRRHVPWPDDPLCLRLDRENRLVSVTTGDWSRKQLVQAHFSPRMPSELRRRLIDIAATEVGRYFNVAFRAESPDWDWLQRMRQDPAAVECEAREIWEQLLERVPPILRIPGVELGIAEFQMLCEGPGSGRDRRWFAQEWPAAALFLLQRGTTKRAFGQVERNRANAVKVAAATLCCQRDRRPCGMALDTARGLPRFKQDVELAELFRNEERFSPRPAQVRGAFMHVNSETRGELLRRLGSNSRFVRPQVEFAIQVGMSPLFSSTRCRFEVAKLVFGILAGSGVDPTAWSEVGVEADDVAQALATVSADALAAFAAWRLEADDWRQDIDIEERQVSDPFQTGVLALVRHLRHGWEKPPTPAQLRELARRIPPLAVHRIETLRTVGPAKENEWPTPPGWREGLVSGLAGATATPLTSRSALRACGDRLRNCLRHDTNIEFHALQGRLVLFSIQADGHEALLSLRAIVRDDGSDGVWVERYERDDCKGFANREPSRGCRNVAQRLMDRLNEALPQRLDAAEVARRRLLRTRMVDNVLSYNEDKTAAGLWWANSAARCLPPRFTKEGAAEIVDDYLLSTVQTPADGIKA